MARKASKLKLDPSVIKLIHASLPRQAAGAYVERLRHWQRAKGKEWMSARLKALWNMALLERAGSHEQIPGVARASRIACDASGYPRGIEGDLIRRFARLQKPSKLRRASVAFRAYTALKLDETSVAQRSKAESSITSPVPESCDSAWVYCLTVAEPWLGNEERATNPFDRRLVRFDSLAKLSGTSKYPGLLKVPGRDHHTRPYSSLAASLLTKGSVPIPLIEALGDWQLRQDAELLQRGFGDMTHGRISVIQEGGAKARVVAMPNAWLQFYCMPYHNYLMRVIRLLESGAWTGLGHTWGMSCATMQTVGVSMALAALEQRRFCAAVDLSSATDRFPLKLQQRTCSILGIYEFGKALEDLRGPWWGLEGSTRTKWYYEVGQPMGLYGSFPLFHLTHYLLLNSLAMSLHLEPNGSHFAVLGDDVLVFNEELRSEYLRALKALQVPVSQHKCYEGNLVEFAGFLITTSGNSATAYRPYKASPRGELMVLNTCHAVGAVVRTWSKWWAKAYDEYVATRGLRDLTLEPLYSDPDDLFGGSGLPGSRWIGSCLNRASLYPMQQPKSDPFIPNVTWELHLGNALRHWESERFALLKEGELLVDIGSPGVTDPSTFDPKDYTRTENARKRTVRALFRDFGHDPLIRAHRERQEELHEMQLT